MLLFRLLDSDLPDKFVSEILDGLQRDGLFPFSRENLVRSAKFKVMHVALNGRLRFAFFRRLLKNKFFFALAVVVSGASYYKLKKS